MKKIIFVVFCLLISACGEDKKSSAPAQASYNYKTIKVDSIYTRWKKDKNDAMERAEKDIKKFVKSACRERIAKGWSLIKVKSTGAMECEETDSGHHCRKSQMELECRQVIEEFPS